MSGTVFSRKIGVPKLLSRALVIMTTLFVIMPVLFFISCDNIFGTAAEAVELMPPVISPAGGDLTAQYADITITTTEESGLIYYTTDGTTPTRDSSLYSSAFRIQGDKNTVKAFVYKSGSSSAVTTAAFTFRANLSGGIIYGTVRLPDVLPAGAEADLSTVSVFSEQNPSYIVRANTEGEFIMSGLDTSVSYTLYFTTGDVGPARTESVQTQSVRSADRSAARGAGDIATILAKQQAGVTASTGTGTELPNVQLKKTGSIKVAVQLYDRLGESVEDKTGVVVYVPGTSFSGYTNEQGSLQMTEIPEGIYKLRYEKSGYTSQQLTDILVLSETETDKSSQPVTLYFGSGVVTGTVVLSGTPDETPNVDYSGSTVLLKNILDQTITYTTATDETGAFYFTSVEPGSYFAQVSRAEFQSSSVEDIIVEGARVTSISSVYLVPLGGSVRGTVTLSDAQALGITHAGITILAENEGGTRTYSTVTNSEGVFLFSSIAAGTYTITAARVGYSSRTLPSISVSNGIAVENMTFTPLEKAQGTITGTATLEGVSDCAGTSILAVHTTIADKTYTTVTDQNGVYIISDAVPGTYRIQLSHDGYVTRADLSVTITNDRPVSVPVCQLLSNKSRISGTILLESAVDHSGTAVLIIQQDTDTPATASGITDNRGRFFIANLNPGRYRVQASHDGYQTVTGDPVILSTGQSNSDTAITLPVSSRSITGQVLLEGRETFSGVRITATNLSEPTRIYSALSNSSGYYALSSMVPGSYLLNYSRENYVDFSPDTVDLSSSSTKNLPTATLSLQRGGITGIVTLEGRTNHSGIAVKLPGTEYSALTGADGTWTITVPSGNYPSGVRYECTDFATSANTDTVTVLNNSTYAVPSAILKATHNTVSGVVDLAGTDNDSGITVSIDGTSYRFVSTESTSFRFEHVPLGSYVLRLERELTPVATVTLNVIPSAQINMGVLTMIPNASGLEGYIRLEDMANYSGVRVTVATAGQEGVVTTSTDASGFFQIGNILSTGTHTISATKGGWSTWSTVLNDLQPLEVREIGVVDEIWLQDVVAPVFSATPMLINGGIQFTSDTSVRVSLNCTEQGSGAAFMQVRLNDYPTEPVWQPYTASIVTDLSGFAAYTGNGTYTLSARVRDRAGNMSSWGSAVVTITDQTTTISGPLGSSNLHWTVDKSPYTVVGSVRVNSGDTLIIDPGVEVRFAGNYYIEVYGTIDAAGTAALPISFARSDDFTDTWEKLFNFVDASPNVVVDEQFNWVSGTRFSNIRVPDDAAFGGGKFYVSDTLFASPNLGSGIFVRCDIDLKNNNGNGIGGSIVDSVVHDDSDGVSIFGLVKDTIVYSIWGSMSINGSIQNVYVERANVVIFEGTVEGLTVRDTQEVYLSGAINGADLQNISGRIVFSGERYWNQTKVSGSSFTDYGKLHTTSQWSNVPVVNLQGNYFGPAATEELNQFGTADNLSFIHDYWDDMTLSRLDLSGYLSSPPSGIGYQGGSVVIGPDVRNTIAASMVVVEGGSSADIPNGTLHGTWSVSDFMMSRYEITREQAVAFLGITDYYRGLSWYDAVEICNKISSFENLTPVYAYTGYGTDTENWPIGWNDSEHNNITFDTTANGYRLPTEAEWEWAARGGKKSHGYTYSGSNTIEDVAWYNDNSGQKVHSVGEKLPNELGLYDMSGNAREWCWDWRSESNICRLWGNNPMGESSGSNRVLRGGSCFDDAFYCEVAAIYSDRPYYRDFSSGFRVVRSSLQ